LRNVWPFALLLCLVGCTPEAASLLPHSIPATPPATKPQILSFDADPQNIAQGQSSSLRWRVKGADNLRVETEFGSIVTEQRRSIRPRNTTTYELIASNGAGSVRAAVTVTVSKLPPAIASPTLSPSTLPVVNSRLKDVHLDPRDGAVAPAFIF
jgi:hypothetical protein